MGMLPDRLQEVSYVGIMEARGSQYQHTVAT